MARGDTVTDGADGTTSSGGTDTIDITAASGVHVAFHIMMVGSGSTNNQSSIFYRDTGASTDWVAQLGGNRGEIVFATNAGDVQAEGKAPVDDTIGLRARFNNSGCSAANRSYAVAGQEVN